MRIAAAFGWAILGGLVIVACGSSSSDGGSTAGACTPGDSKACTGVGGCSGGQVCNQSGTAYGDCACGGGTDGGSSDASGDAGANNDSGVDAAAPWTPKNLSDLELWTEGTIVDSPDAGYVSEWPDQSPKADNLNTLSGNPRIHHAAIGGLDALTFTKASVDTVQGTAPDLEADGFVIEVVAAFGACTAETCILWSTVNHADPAGVCNVTFDTSGGTTLTVTWDCNDLMKVTKTATFGAGPHLFGLRRTSATAAEIRIDGTASTFAVASSELITPALSFGLGNLDGDVAEIVIAHNPSDSDVTQLESYLKAKYGL